MKHSSSQLIPVSLRILLFGISFFVPFLFSSSVTAAELFDGREVVDRVNRDRALFGLPALLFDEALAQAARLKADDMVKKGYFAHTSPEGTTPWFFFEKAGYRYRYAGENLAIHFSDIESEQRAWMASEKHRENILSPKYRETGVAVASLSWEGKETTVTVQLFGTRIGDALAESSSWKSLSGDVSIASRAIHSDSKPDEQKEIIPESKPIISSPVVLSSASPDATFQVLFLAILLGIGFLECVALIAFSRLFFRRQRALHLRIATPM